MHTRLVSVCFGLAVFFSFAVAAMAVEPIKALSVKGFGEYGNNAGVLIDRAIPPEETEYTDPACVYWHTAGTYFIIDLGSVVQIEGITIQVDNNDDYSLEVSEDGKKYSPLLFISSDWGEMGFGMETISTVKGNPEYIPEAALVPSRGRYLKLSAGGGDDAYAASEVLVFGKQDAPASHHATETPKKEGLEQIFDSMDADHDSKVSLDEYAAIWKDKLDVPANFAYFDKDHSGYIERSEYLGLARNLKTKKKPVPTAPPPKHMATPPSPSADETIPSALQGGINLKLDPNKVRNALPALSEWPKLTDAVKNGQTQVIDDACRKYHFESWYELDMIMSRICNIGTQLIDNPSSKDHFSSRYGQKAVDILSTAKARKELKKHCPR
ncbi:MAG: hypothetical protein MIO92_14000 [Methanosarcinaceae archaeon]|nr:hypothetical protein [Methanosarcinaceae archaeon]